MVAVLYIPSRVQHHLFLQNLFFFFFLLFLFLPPLPFFLFWISSAEKRSEERKTFSPAAAPPPRPFTWKDVYISVNNIGKSFCSFTLLLLHPLPRLELNCFKTLETKQKLIESMPFARPEKKIRNSFTLRFMLRVLVPYNRNQEKKTVYSPFEKKTSPWNIWFVCVCVRQRRGCGMWFFKQIFFFSFFSQKSLILSHFILTK